MPRCTWPNSVDSSSSAGSEPLFTATKGNSARGELVWMALAISSLPVPVSPVTRMVERLAATCSTRSMQPQHALALADDIGEVVALLQRALELGVLLREALPGDHAVDFDQQFFVVPGLGEIVVRAEFEGPHRAFHAAVSGDHEDRRFGIAARADRAARPCRICPASSDPAAPGRRALAPSRFSPSVAFCARSTE